MADIAYQLHNGLNTSGDPLRLGPGFLRRCEGAIYMSDDPDRPYKHPGRTTAAALPAAATANNTKGLVHLQYEDADDKFLLLANTQLYKVTAATSGIVAGSWASVNDQQAVPVAFPRTGSFLKAIPDGDNAWISWDGNENSRPLIHEEGGHSWFLGMRKPVSGEVTAITSAPTIVRPDSATAVSGSIQFKGQTVTVDGTGWISTAASFDADNATQARNYENGGAKVYHGLLLEFTDASTIPSGQNLHLILGGFAKAYANAELYVQVSYNNGTSFSTWAPNATLALSWKNPDHSGGTTTNPYKEEFVIPLTAGGLWVDVHVRIISRHGLFGATQASIFEVFSQPAAAGAASAVDAGTYYYCHTEVFEVGEDRLRVIESAPSQPVKIVLAGTEVGVLYTFDTTEVNTNNPIDGVKDDSTNNLKHYRKIYRTTKSGVWPDLGYIGTSSNSALSWTDSFTVDGETLGAPGINIVYEKDVPIEAAGVPPAFLDAVYFRGMVVAIPANDPFQIIWSLPGQPHYFPFPSHQIRLTPTAKNDALKGVSSVGDSLIVFARTQVSRIRVLPVVDQSNYNAQSIEVETISPNEGLAGSPLSHTVAHSQKGHAIVVWVSDNGIWMTDGSLVAEGGMGINKLSVHMDWRREVDTTQLSETRLSYDPVLQIIIFEYVDNDSNRQVKYLHTSPHHWVASGQDQSVPKMTGPHTQFVGTQRAFGEISGEIRHWTLDKTALAIYNERDGVDLSGTKIVTHIESGLTYLAGSRNEFHAYEGALLHSDWGPSEACDLEIRTFRDDVGIPQVLHKKGIGLNGERESSFFVNRAGQSMAVVLRHEGKTISDGSSLRAFGPLTFDVVPMGEVEK